MISKETFKVMQEKYGLVGSWAIWMPATDTPKSNTHNMDWVKDSDLLDNLDTGYVFVGLNWSSTHGDQSEGYSTPWTNFHSGYAYQNDYKLRYALTGTKYWGSYITDLIKLYSEVDSGKVKSYLKKNPQIVLENIKSFEEEISYLRRNPVLVALGGDTYNILNKYLGHKYNIVQIKHYSFTISKENYRSEVLDILSSY